MGATGIYIGLGLMIVGLVLFLAALRKRSSAIASHGSVSVGRDNSGPIVNVNHSAAQSAHTTGHGVTVAAILVELVGIGVTLWHAYHLAIK